MGDIVKGTKGDLLIEVELGPLPKRIVWGKFKPAFDTTLVKPKAESVTVYDPRPKWEHED